MLLRKNCLKSFLLSALMLAPFAKNFSQQCDSRYIISNYRTLGFGGFNKIAFTTAQEVISAGSLQAYNGAGHMARYSKNGLPLWSYYYTLDYVSLFYGTFLSKLTFNDFAATDDGGVMVTGTAVRSYNDRIGQYLNNLAVIGKINKYGIVEWNKNFITSAYVGDLSFTNIIKTAGGDFIVYMANDKGPSSYSFNRIIRFSAKGDIKWVSELSSGSFDAGGSGLNHKRALLQARDKSIIVADVVHRTDKASNTFKITDGRLHFFSLDYATGKLKWESDYQYDQPSGNNTFIPDVHLITEMPDGKFSFTTGLYFNGNNVTPGKKPVSIVTSNKGVAEKLVYYNSVTDDNPVLVDAENGIVAGEKKVFLKSGGTSVVVSVNADQNAGISNAYTASYEPRSFATGTRGWAIVMSDNNSFNYKILLTDSEGNADCAASSFVAKSTMLNPVLNSTDHVITTVKTLDDKTYKAYFGDTGYPLNAKEEYPLVFEKDCEEELVCCKDYIDSVHIIDIKICENKPYTLPDNTVIKDSGTYYVTLKTAAGCDSIRFFHIQTEKNTQSMSLGQDTCIQGQGNIEIRATEGYKNYSWIGAAPSQNSSYTVSRPGTYWVSVSNACGSKTDSVQVYDQCDFPVYMPTAFTPNGDRLNDRFGFPLQNKNRLISLSVYNKWGQLIFKSAPGKTNWDGTINGIELKSDVFIYYLITEGLSGKKLSQKGTVTLIR